MKNLDMKKKIVISFSVVILCFAIAIVTTIMGLKSTGDRYTTFFTMRHESTMRARNIRLHLNIMAKNVLLATTEDDQNMSNNSIVLATNSRDQIKSELDWFNANFDGDMSLMQQFQSIMDSSASLREQITTLAQENTEESNRQSQNLMINEYNPIIEEAGELIKKFNDEQNVIATNNYEAAMRSQKLQMVLALSLAAVAVIFAVVMAVVLISAVVTPVQEMQKAMKGIEDGDLKVNVNYEAKDELGKLADSLRGMVDFLRSMIGDVDFLLDELSKGNFTVRSKMTDAYVGDFKSMLLSILNLKDNLNATMGQINSSSDQVASGSDQVSSGAQALSQGATEQASSVEELAATINEISQKISYNAESAKSASTRSDQVRGQAEESNNHMKEMLSAMQDISDASEEIGKIIKTIEDIAFQTNILALNAAVEAARAGTAGKGFAVVADEVRNLAGKSADASANTSSLIERALQAVQRGTKIASETAQALNEVVTGVEDVAGTIGTISSASEEQANAVRQVTVGIDQISSVVQTNSATAEESAAASEELSGQAQILKDLVGKFRLDGESGPASYSPAPAASSSRSYDMDMSSSYEPDMYGSKY